MFPDGGNPDTSNSAFKPSVDRQLLGEEGFVTYPETRPGSEVPPPKERWDTTWTSVETKYVESDFRDSVIEEKT